MYSISNNKYGFYFQELPLNNLRFYLYSAVFIFGNILFPALLHQLPMGGKMFLPIYFFILIGGYRHGWKVGLLTALLSPLLNHLLTGMPPVPMLAMIIIKGGLLGVSAGLIAKISGRLTLFNIGCCILFYQISGSLFEWFFTHDINAVFSEFSAGYPGLLLQWLGGYLLLRFLNRNA